MKHKRTVGEINRHNIINYFRQHSEWIDVTTLARKLGLSVNVVRSHCYSLEQLGLLSEIKLVVARGNATERNIIHFCACPSASRR